LESKHLCSGDINLKKISGACHFVDHTQGLACNKSIYTFVGYLLIDVEEEPFILRQLEELSNISG
jgi:hypothetical protein